MPGRMVFDEAMESLYHPWRWTPAESGRRLFSAGVQKLKIGPVAVEKLNTICLHKRVQYGVEIGFRWMSVCNQCKRKIFPSWSWQLGWLKWQTDHNGQDFACGHSLQSCLSVLQPKWKVQQDWLINQSELRSPPSHPGTRDYVDYVD